jgi:hypothetical protein
MQVEWQGDHKILGEDVKQDFESELKKLGFDPARFLVEVRREPTAEKAHGLRAIRYNVFVSDLDHPERDTWILRGGNDENWIEQFRKNALSHR